MNEARMETEKGWNLNDNFFIFNACINSRANKVEIVVVMVMKPF